MKNDMENPINFEKQKEKSKMIEEDVKQHMESIMQKELLTEYLKETQGELDAYSELLEKQNIIPRIADYFDDRTQPEIEWGYANEDDYYFRLKQDYWLVNGNRYIAFGDEDDMNEQCKHQEDTRDTYDVVPITPKSTLLKRKKWLLKQLANLDN